MSWTAKFAQVGEIMYAFLAVVVFGPVLQGRFPVTIDNKLENSFIFSSSWPAPH